MKPSLRLLLILALTSTLCPASELHWRNGEWIGGDFIGVEGDHAIWRTPMFGEPLRIRLNALKRVNRHKLDEATQEPFSLRLTDGSRLYGTITGLNESTLEMKSDRYGTLRIKRDAVVNVQRLKAEGMLFAQPTTPNGWVEGKPATSGNASAKTNYWRAVPGAALKQVGWNRTVSLPVEAPELVEMQFVLTSTVRPEFKLELKAADKSRLIVETWVDEVVLQGLEFQSVKRMAESDHRVKMTLFWNRKSGLCAVYGPDGKKILESRKPAVDDNKPLEKAKAAEKTAGEEKKPAAKGGGLFGALIAAVEGVAEAPAAAMAAARVQAQRQPGDPEASVGLTLLNKGPDLKLEGLRIRVWDGKLPDDITEARPRVELTDGRYLKVTPLSATATDLTVRDVKGQETVLPWDKVLAVEVNATNSPFYQIANPSVELWFTDGEWVQGVLQEVRNDAAVLKTAFSAEPVKFKITRMHHLMLRGYPDEAPEGGLAALDKLTLEKKVLHGKLDASGQDKPRWTLLGALEPVTIASTGDLEIARSPTAKLEDIRSEALFYLGNGDVLPGRLRAIDAKQVDIDSELTTVKQLPAAKMQAIQFGGRMLNLDGFEDEGWRRLRGTEETVKRNGKAGIDFEAGGSWGHPSFMQVNEIGFTLVSNGFSAMRVRLFCDGVNPAAPSVNLLFGHMGSEVCFGLEANGQQMDRQSRVGSGGAPMPVRITVAEEMLEVFLNGVSQRKIPLTPKMRSGSGIIIEPFSLWGNGERELKITSFQARVAPGRIAAPAVDMRSKEHALTVPRFRKEDPPKHVLVAANGDLLRGVIEAATAQHFAVRSGLETIQVPRDRVKAAVWLVRPVDDVNAAFEARAREGEAPVLTHWLLLSNGGRLGLKVERFADDAVIGKSELLGECRVPLTQIHAIRSTIPADNTAMVALRDWKLKFAPEPVLPETGGESSPLLNQDAKPFKLPLLAGGDFDLAKEKGKVIVLDFWATWCGPCIKSLPDMMDQMSTFDAKQVRFIGVNQAEAKDQVKSFLETRGWKMEVALDANQRVGQSFKVEGIPHTVVIGPDGKVAYVKTGYEPDGAKKIAEVVKKLLGDKAAAPGK